MCDECRHVVTQGRESEPGSWCVACGVKVFAVHDRPCSECAHFLDMGAGQIPICRKHMMGVSRSMLVTYRLIPEPDLCFEEKTA